MNGAASTLARTLVRRRAEAQMTSRVSVLRGALGALDPTSGLVAGIGGASVVYTGKAHIRTVAAAGAVAVGEGVLATRQTMVSIPIGAAMPHRDDLVRIEADGDADLPTRVFRVTDVEGGGIFGEARRLSCTGWHESRYWGQQ